MNKFIKSGLLTIAILGQQQALAETFNSGSRFSCIS